MPKDVEFSQPPMVGRVFAATRRVRLGDVTPRGRLRLDACVRYLQDIAHDDARDAAYVDKDGWVVRRTALRVHSFPVFQEPLQLRTWCGGLGSHWAERCTVIEGDRGGRIEAAAVWVHVDLGSMMPTKLATDFLAVASESAGGRKVGARVLLRSRPTDTDRRHPWPLRFSDMDALGHMNNAAYWEAIEEWLGAHREVRAPFDVVLEHLAPITVGHEVSTCVREGDGLVNIWHEVDHSVAAAAELRWKVS
jgi:acyl-ACP thioesterase